MVNDFDVQGKNSGHLATCSGMSWGRITLMATPGQPASGTPLPVARRVALDGDAGGGEQASGVHLLVAVGQG
jgi:hypothetical protein